MRMHTNIKIIQWYYMSDNTIISLFQVEYTPIVKSNKSTRPKEIETTNEKKKC